MNLSTSINTLALQFDLRLTGFGKKAYTERNSAAAISKRVNILNVKDSVHASLGP